MLHATIVSDLLDEPLAVQEIEIWYSERRTLWVVERVAADGHVIGAAHYCMTEIEAIACSETWADVDHGARISRPQRDTGRAKRVPRSHRRAA